MWRCFGRGRHLGLVMGLSRLTQLWDILLLCFISAKHVQLIGLPVFEQSQVRNCLVFSVQYPPFLEYALLGKRE
ncbi:hypothetical protein HDK77DRAFT_451485 [Phyllosticta capitalensis]|uniref:Secreted protein n=1 Tax=Phyllosticta capitalensis TaxID=121624 RepID=A0ABR1YAF1_9PEZI